MVERNDFGRQQQRDESNPQDLLPHADKFVNPSYNDIIHILVGQLEQK